MAIRLVGIATSAPLLLTAATLVGALRAPAGAAFPGRNGRLVVDRELPADNHTQSDLYTAEPD